MYHAHELGSPSQSVERRIWEVCKFGNGKQTRRKTILFLWQPRHWGACPGGSPAPTIKTISESNVGSLIQDGKVDSISGSMRVLDVKHTRLKSVVFFVRVVAVLVGMALLQKRNGLQTSQKDIMEMKSGKGSFSRAHMPRLEAKSVLLCM
jgi:hypothetical protein